MCARNMFVGAVGHGRQLSTYREKVPCPRPLATIPMWSRMEKKMRLGRAGWSGTALRL